MTTQAIRDLVRHYFAAETAGSVEGVTELFDSVQEIHNAANPPLVGPDAARRFCEDFYARTSDRQFKVLGVASNENMVFAWWEGTITFRAGAAFGDVKAKRPFSVTLRGVCRFDVHTINGKIRRLDVFHETTTAARVAREQT